MTSECNNAQGLIEAILSQSVSSKCTITLQISSHHVGKESAAAFSTRSTAMRQNSTRIRNRAKTSLLPFPGKAVRVSSLESQRRLTP
eukprot:6182469-Pleurochrysis_carterae.AAC.1